MQRLSLKKSVRLLLLLIALNANALQASSHFNLSWIKEGLVACGVGTGYYLYSSYKPEPLSDYYHELQKNAHGPITIFVHGYEDTHRQAYRYLDSIITTPALVTFNFADAGKEILRINRKETSMAQRNEIERLRNVLEKVKKEYPGQDIVLFGLSRGASTIINMLATYPDTQVKAVLLESPFGHLQDIVSNLIRTLGWEKIPGIYMIGMSFAKCLFPKFSLTGMHPIDVVDKLPQDLPILIVASLEDQLVPASSSKALYDKLISTYHPNARLLLVDHGKHAKIITAQDKQLYKDTVYAFLKQFGLPYDKSNSTREERLCYAQNS